MSTDGHRAAVAGIAGRAPVRGTQSFVGVMSEVWRRPSLTGTEIAFRWLACAPLLIYAWRHGGSAALADPAQAFASLQMQLRGSLAFGGRSLAMLAGFLVWWSLFSTLSRRVLLRRAGGRTASLPTLFTLTLLRVFSFSAIVGLWFYIVATVMRRDAIDLAAWSTNPNMVGAFAIVVVGTLALFVFWALTSWILRLAPVLAAQRGLGPGAALAATFRDKLLRSKLVEINLVMGIVKIALLVLAMVFSACPLPFQAVATREFLTNWWIGVALFYLLLSDYFHVVRMTAYLRLFQALRGDESR